MAITFHWFVRFRQFFVISVAENKNNIVQTKKKFFLATFFNFCFVPPYLWKGTGPDVWEACLKHGSETWKRSMEETWVVWLIHVWNSAVYTGFHGVSTHFLDVLIRFLSFFALISGLHNVVLVFRYRNHKKLSNSDRPVHSYGHLKIGTISLTNFPDFWLKVHIPEGGSGDL